MALPVSQSGSRSVSREPRRQLVSRACDRCKARKIKCCGNEPCRQCSDSSSICTYLVTQRVLGPRGGLNLRHRSRHSNDEHRDFSFAEGVPSQSASRPETSGPSRNPTCSNKTEERLYHLSTHNLATQLRLFSSKLAAIWPIVDVDI